MGVIAALLLLAIFVVSRGVSTMDSRAALATQPEVPPVPYLKPFTTGRSFTNFARVTKSGLFVRGEQYGRYPSICPLRFTIFKVGNHQSFSSNIRTTHPLASASGVRLYLNVKALQYQALLVYVPADVATVSWVVGGKIIDRESGVHGLVPFAVPLDAIGTSNETSYLTVGHARIPVTLTPQAPAPTNGSC